MKYSMGLLPIDTLILKHMPEEGTELAEYIPLGPSSRALAKRIDGITSSQIGGRLQTLERLGYCVPIPLLPVSQGRGWQRTAKAVELLAEVVRVGVYKAIDDVNATVNEPEGEMYDASSSESAPTGAQERGE